MASQKVDSELLAYARHHQLTRDYSLDDVLDVEFHVPPHGDVSRAINDPDGSPPLEASCKSPEPEELVPDVETQDFLAETQRLAEHDPFGSSNGSPRSIAKRLKLDLPLLRTDPAADLIRPTPKPVNFLPADLHAKALETDDAQDEGLGWPKKYLALPEDFDTKFKTQKWTYDDFLELAWMETFLDPAAPFLAVVPDLFQVQGNYKRPPGPLTPPLSPMMASISAVQSSPLTVELPLASDHTSPSAHLLARLDQSLADEDLADLVMLDGENSLADEELMHFPLLEDENSVNGLINAPNSLQPGWRPDTASPTQLDVRGLRLEQTLTPTNVYCPPHPDPSSDMALGAAVPELGPIYSDFLNFSDDDVNEEIVVNFTQYDHAAREQLKGEKLSDTTHVLHLRVPNVQQSVETLPWAAQVSDAAWKIEEHAILGDVKAMKLHKLPVGDIEKNLPWNPFQMQEIDNTLNETISDDGVTEQFLYSFDKLDDINHDSLSWKPEGLRVLDSVSDDDDEISPGKFEPPGTISRPLLKRKEDSAEDTPICRQPSKPKMESRPFQLPSHLAERARKSDSGRPPMDPGTAEGQDLFSASNELSRFMDVYAGHIPKKPKLDTPPDEVQDSAGVALMAQQGHPKSMAAAITPNAEGDSSIQPHPPVLTAPLPILKPGLDHPIIVCTRLLASNRPLLSRLTQLHPQLQIIERDFSKGAPSCPSRQGSTSITYSTDGDMLISPGTSLIITTMQKASQKPLPGHGAVPPLHDRIFSVAHRCERCVVLVSSKAGSPGNSPGNEHETPVLSGLVSFCESLSALADVSAEVMLVIDDPRELARHILGLIAIEVATRGDEKPFDLIEDETSWEVFLGRAGMNAYAAQVVMAELKPPQGLENGCFDVEAQKTDRMLDWLESSGVRGCTFPSSDSALGGTAPSFGVGAGVVNPAHGLPAFVVMSSEERKARLGILLGGSKMLERVALELSQRCRK